MSLVSMPCSQPEVPIYNCIVDYFMSHSSAITHFAILKASVCALDSLLGRNLPNRVSGMSFLYPISICFATLLNDSEWKKKINDHDGQVWGLNQRKYLRGARVKYKSLNQLGSFTLKKPSFYLNLWYSGWMKAWQSSFFKENNVMWIFIHLIELLLWHPTKKVICSS